MNNRAAARNLADDLDRTCALAITFADVLEDDLVIAEDRDYSHMQARADGMFRALSRHLDEARTLSRHLARARDRALDFYVDLTTDSFERVRSIDRHIADGLDRSRDANLIETAEDAWGFDDALGVDLIRSCAGRARDMARHLTKVSEQLRAGDLDGLGDASLAIRRARAAGSIVRRVTQLLPLAHRARYREEFDAELHALASAKAPRHAQVLYALRVAVRVVAMWRALRERTPAQSRPQ